MRLHLVCDFHLWNGMLLVVLWWNGAKHWPLPLSVQDFHYHITSALRAPIGPRPCPGPQLPSQLLQQSVISAADPILCKLGVGR